MPEFTSICLTRAFACENAFAFSLRAIAEVRAMHILKGGLNKASAMQHYDIPKFEPEVAERMRRNLGPRLAHMASTTTFSRIIVRGTVVWSPFRIAAELEAMIAMVMWLSADLVPSVTSIIADKRTSRKYHVAIGERPENLELIADQLEQACLRTHNGHGGLSILVPGSEPLQLPPRKAVEYPVPF